MKIGPLEITAARKGRDTQKPPIPQSRSPWQSRGQWASLLAIPNPNDYKLYRLIRDNVPAVQAAINIYRALVGRPIVVADEPLAEELTTFLDNLRVNQFSRGIQTAQNIHVGNMIGFGMGIAEIVPTNSGKDIYSLVTIDPETIILKNESEDSGQVGIYQRQVGQDVRLDPFWLVTNLYQPENNPYGVSICRSMAFVAEVLVTIERELLNTHERFGTPAYQVRYIPPENFTDPTGEKSNAILQNLQASFAEASIARKSGTVRDFFTVGDVEISVIGADGQVLDFAVPYRSLMEQIAGATMLPSWMLGFTWSTTERLSRHQADLINTVVNSMREELENSWRYLCALWMALNGRSGEFEITWDAINLLDATEQSRADLAEAQAVAQREKNAMRLWATGIYTQEQYAEHTLREKWDGNLSKILTEPPAMDYEQQGAPAMFSDYPEASRAGTGEQPKSEQVRDAINSMYRDILDASADLRQDVFSAVGLPITGKMAQFADDPFKYTAEQDKVLQEAISRFLSKMAGPDLSRAGFVDPDTPDGIIQEWDRFAYAIGLNRARDMRGDVANALLPDRNAEGIQRLLTDSFDRLSENGKLRLETQLEDIRTVIQEGMAGGASPLDVADRLSQRFDKYNEFEFARLARTEIAFAQTRGLSDQLAAEGVDMGGVNPMPPFHPNCLCDISVDTNNPNRAVYEIADTACPICSAYINSGGRNE